MYTYKCNFENRYRSRYRYRYRYKTDNRDTYENRYTYEQMCICLFNAYDLEMVTMTLGA